MQCRHCKNELAHTMINLGTSPPSNSYLTEEGLKQPEKFYPLRAMVCEKCWLVQTDDFVGSGEMFTKDYAYFSSYSTSWLAHAKAYVNMIKDKFGLTVDNMFVEVAANDGYLLQYIKEAGIPCYGVEPTKSTAEVAREKGIEIFEEFFGLNFAKQMSGYGKQADFIVANNVLAHVPDINDFVSGFAILLKENGVVTFEFPHLQNLIQKNQFDTVYHEHYSYLSLTAVKIIFEANNLQVFDVEELQTHGGSLRVFAQRFDTGQRLVTERVKGLLIREGKLGMTSLEFYKYLQARAEKIKFDLLTFLLSAKKRNETVVAYGAAAKGNTLLNFSGIGCDLLMAVADKNPYKTGKYLPGSRLPIVSPAEMLVLKPDHILILPWNLRDEIRQELEIIRTWGGKFVTAIPKLEVW